MDDFFFPASHCVWFEQYLGGSRQLWSLFLYVAKHENKNKNNLSDSHNSAGGEGNVTQTIRLDVQAQGI